jgi:hypothetical protein
MPNPRPSTRSSNRKTTGDITKEAPRGRKQPRAHRDNTPEAKAQRARSPKTHPTRAVGAQRKPGR